MKNNNKNMWDTKRYFITSAVWSVLTVILLFLQWYPNQKNGIDDKIIILFVIMFLPWFYPSLIVLRYQTFLK